MSKIFFAILLSTFVFFACNEETYKINRQDLVKRNNPKVNEIDSLASLSVGNGEFALTVDVTGLQTFPEIYSKGVPLGTQSQWGWHSFPNTENYQFEETLQEYDFGHGQEGLYAVQFSEGRKRDAANWHRANPHRLHLGLVGFELTNSSGEKLDAEQITRINQSLDLFDGVIKSRFSADNNPVSVSTVCDPNKDLVAASIKSSMIEKGQLAVNFRFAYPTGKHADDAMDWSSPDKHRTEIESKGENSVTLKRTLDTTIYFVNINWEGEAKFSEKEQHYFLLAPQNSDFSFTCLFSEKKEDAEISYELAANNSSNYWNKFWNEGAAVDFSQCKDERAKELERRIVLSQYLMAIQSAGSLPPQETGLTYNSWFGKFHLEMHWWHAAHFALWNRLNLLERSLDWYNDAYPVAKEIAKRQGFDGVRWMKMTDPSAKEAPSGVGSFLIWQQPHYIYFAELVYRQKGTDEVLEKYRDLVFETAKFMADFASYDEGNDRYVLKGIIPAQETLPASETVNPPFELSYWHWGLSTAQKWRERIGLEKDPKWGEVINKLSVLASKDSLYLAAESAPETYHNVRFTSDHMAVLGAYGILPKNNLFELSVMENTLDWVWDNWNWDHTWGWDYPMTAMCAARLGRPEKAVSALLMNERTNTCLVNGHNFQSSRLRIYLPGNGGLLIATAMMCAGWDGNEEINPGFPKDGTWNVKWEGLKPIP